MTNKKIKEIRNNLPEREFPETLSDLYLIFDTLDGDQTILAKGINRKIVKDSNGDIVQNPLLDYFKTVYLPFVNLDSYCEDEIYLTNNGERIFQLVNIHEFHKLNIDDKCKKVGIDEFIYLLKDELVDQSIKWVEFIKSITFYKKILENPNSKDKVTFYSRKEFKRRYKKENPLILEIEVDEDTKTYFETILMLGDN